MGDADAELLRLEQMARTGLEPRIPNIQTKAIQIDVGGKILAIRIPRSYRQPHRIVFQGRNRFWSRSSAGEFEPNVDELRALFNFAPQLAEQMRQFRFDRIARMTIGEGPVKLADAHCLVLHIVPFTHFMAVGPLISLSDVMRNAQLFPPLGTTSRSDWRINFDGFVTLSNSHDHAEGQRAYVQVFRSGTLEAVASCISGATKIVNVVDLARIVVDYLYLYSAALHECGIQPPLAVMASLIGLKQLILTTGKRSIAGQVDRQTADRDQFHFTELILDKVSATKQECARNLRPMLDQLANAAGCISAQSFIDGNNYFM
jgi:hypothetical protein